MPNEAGLAEEDFLGPPLQASPRLLDALEQAPAGSVCLWAPAFVALDAGRALSVIAGVHLAAAEVERLAFFRRASVVAVELGTGRTRVTRFGSLVEGPGLPARLPPAPGFEGGLGPTSGAFATQVARCELWRANGDASLDAPPWPPGRYRLAAIAADRISNDVDVEIARSPTTVDAAAPSGETRTPSILPPPDPMGGLPHYHAAKDSPPPPTEPGVVLAARRVVEAAEGATCTLQGAVRARSRAGDRVGSVPVIPVTLVITGSESARAHVVAMRIPSFDRAPAASPEATHTAHFAVDLLRLAPLAASPQTYFVYAFTADGHAGPQPVAVVAA